jgi:MFS family permease
MILNTVTVCSAITATWIYKYLALHFGTRSCMLWTAPLLLVMSLFWWFVPDGAPWFWFIFPFILVGATSFFISTSQANYFTVTAPPQLVVPGTILIYLTNGALAGILGMILNPLLHNIIWRMDASSPMTHYRIFLSVGAVIFLVGFLATLLWHRK